MVGVALLVFIYTLVRLVKSIIRSSINTILFIFRFMLMMLLFVLLTR